jgi:hypothetical protein
MESNFSGLTVSFSIIKPREILAGRRRKKELGDDP